MLSIQINKQLGPAGAPHCTIALDCKTMVQKYIPPEVEIPLFRVGWGLKFFLRIVAAVCPFKSRF